MRVCTDRLRCSCRHPTVSSLRPRICLFRHSFKRRQHHDNQFFYVQCYQKAGKKSQDPKSNSIVLRSRNSADYKVRSSRSSVGKFLTSPHARDDVSSRPSWRTPSCKSLDNQLQKQKKHNEQIVTQTVFEKCSMQRGCNMQPVFKTVIGKFDIFQTVTQLYLNSF